jgi:hypothetical protein
MTQLLETLQRGAADGSVTIDQAVAALTLRLESLGETPSRMLDHVRLIAEVARIYPAQEYEDDLCELLLRAVTALETWGQYAAAREALQVIESRGCVSAVRRGRYPTIRIAFGETGRVDAGFEEADPGFWKTGAGRYTRAYLMWIGGAGAAVDHNREALLAVESPGVALALPLIVGVSCASVGNLIGGRAALAVFQERLGTAAARPDPATIAFFHALRARIHMSDDAAFADADLRAADAIVESVPDSLPWAYVKTLRADALLRLDLESSDRIISMLDASPVNANFIGRRLLQGLTVRRAIASGQHDAFRLAIQQHAEAQELLHALASNAEEVDAVSHFWRHRWDMASGAESLASHRHSSALLDRFLVMSILNRFQNATQVLRKVGAAHSIGRAMGWSDADLRHLRSIVLFEALPAEEQAVIAPPSSGASRHRAHELAAVVVAAALVADGIEESRETLLRSLRSRLTAANPVERVSLNAAIGLVVKQDIRRLIEHQVRELSECSTLPLG